ncbi:MAG: NAD(P)/FAD-dependent oxidoreductase [Phycisphaerales bacterium]
MLSREPPHILIVGAGLAGALMACYLARRGVRISVYERRPDPRAAGFVGGRSINLALSARGIAGLAGVGLDGEVLAQAIRMPGRMIHPVSGPTVFQPYSANPADAINSISRSGLNLTLIHAAARHPGVSFHFDHPCVDVDLHAPAGLFRAPSGETVRIEADLVIGGDGAFSAVRGAMQKTDRFDYSQSYLEHGYKELHIPAAAGGAFSMPEHALHIWPRGGSMMIALPNPDGTFTCTLFWPFQGDHAFTNLRMPADVERHFREHYPDAVSLMPTLVEDYFHNPTSSLVTIRCAPWQAAGRSVLIGDAAHAIVPFFGQGMNAAFEDCVVLDGCLARWAGSGARDADDLAAALDEYQRLRKPNADAIADMALENFVEMRDRVGRPEFLYKKKIEQTVHELFPDRVAPLYNLVSFSTVPYTEALSRGRALDAALERIITQLPREEGASLPPHGLKERVRALAEPLLVKR